MTIRFSEICVRFHWDSAAGVRPNIEQILSQAQPEEKAELLEDLLRIDIELRISAGEHPDPQEYFERFPEQASLIEQLCRDQGVPSLEIASQQVGHFRLLKKLGRGAMGRSSWQSRRVLGPGRSPSSCSVRTRSTLLTQPGASWTRSGRWP